MQTVLSCSNLAVLFSTSLGNFANMNPRDIRRAIFQHIAMEGEPGATGGGDAKLPKSRSRRYDRQGLHFRKEKVKDEQGNELVIRLSLSRCRFLLRKKCWQFSVMLRVSEQKFIIDLTLEAFWQPGS